MTKKQKDIFQKLAKDTGGFGNGHVFYMVTRLKDDEVGELAELLDQYAEDVLICELEYTENTVTFHTHEKCIGDIPNEISERFPDAAVYWNDCWDYEGLMLTFKNGYEVEPSDICTVKVTLDEESECDEDYFATLATVTDMVTGAEFEIGGGMIEEDQREMILSY